MNKNTVPGEKRSPFVTSGVRIGTPAVTTRGLKKPEMGKIAGWVREAFKHHADDTKLARIKSEVVALAKLFPLYPEWTK